MQPILIFEWDMAFLLKGILIWLSDLWTSKRGLDDLISKNDIKVVDRATYEEPTV